MALNVSAHAETKVTNPNDLQPQHLFDDLIVAAPDYLTRMIRENDFGYSIGSIQNQQIAIFTERGPCPSYGCAVVILKSTEDELFDPIVFYAQEDTAPFSYNFEADDDSVVLCLTGQTAFAC